MKRKQQKIENDILREEFKEVTKSDRESSEKKSVSTQPSEQQPNPSVYSRTIERPQTPEKSTEELLEDSFELTSEKKDEDVFNYSKTKGSEAAALLEVEVEDEESEPEEIEMSDPMYQGEELIDEIDAFDYSDDEFEANERDAQYDCTGNIRNDWDLEDIKEEDDDQNEESFKIVKLNQDLRYYQDKINEMVKQRDEKYNFIIEVSS